MEQGKLQNSFYNRNDTEKSLIISQQECHSFKIKLKMILKHFAAGLDEQVNLQNPNVTENAITYFIVAGKSFSFKIK